MGSCDTGIVTWYSLVLLSCTYVGDMVSLVLSACCWHWISCSISVVSTMLPFAVQTLGGWSAWCCLGLRACIFQNWSDKCHVGPAFHWRGADLQGSSQQARILLALLLLMQVSQEAFEVSMMPKQRVLLTESSVWPCSVLAIVFSLASSAHAGLMPE